MGKKLRHLLAQVGQCALCSHIALLKIVQDALSSRVLMLCLQVLLTKLLESIIKMRLNALEIVMHFLSLHPNVVPCSHSFIALKAIGCSLHIPVSRHESQDQVVYIGVMG